MVGSMGAGSSMVVRVWVSWAHVRENGRDEERTSMVHEEPKRCMVFPTGVWFSLQCMIFHTYMISHGKRRPSHVHIGL